MKTGLSKGSNILSEAAFDYYGQQLKALSVLDFDDLLSETLVMLEDEDKNSIRKNHQILEPRWPRAFRHR